MLLHGKANDDFLKWFDKNYKEVDNHLAIKQALILEWLDTFKDLGNGKTAQSLMRKCLKNWEDAMTFLEMQRWVIEESVKIYNANEAILKY